MKVSELIKTLQGLDPDLDVEMEGCHDDAICAGVTVETYPYFPYMGDRAGKPYVYLVSYPVRDSNA